MSIKWHTYEPIRKNQEQLFEALKNIRDLSDRDNALSLIIASHKALSQGIGLSWQEVEEILSEVYR